MIATNRVRHEDRLVEGAERVALLELLGASGLSRASRCAPDFLFVHELRGASAVVHFAQLAA